METNEILKELRQQKHLTQQELATILDINLSSYQKYERPNNTIKPSIEALIKIADFYGVTVDYLLGREPSKAEPIEQFAKQMSMQEMEQDILERWLKLRSSEREMVLDFLRDIVHKDDAKKQQEDNSMKRSDINIKPSPTLRMTQGQLIARRTDGAYENRQATPEELKKLELIKDDLPPDF
ncbi:MAG: helix-turn-helix domain-containing protein [Oscillospiraceae bacterium]|nr:helix-turn-helix domain-containing protein [Oscillospiraceae bacterium]